MSAFPDGVSFNQARDLTMPTGLRSGGPPPSEPKPPPGTHVTKDIDEAKATADPFVSDARIRSVPVEVVLRFERLLTALLVVGMLGLALAGYGFWTLAHKLDVQSAHRAVEGFPK